MSDFYATLDCQGALNKLEERDGERGISILQRAGILCVEKQ